MPLLRPSSLTKLVAVTVAILLLLRNTSTLAKAPVHDKLARFRFVDDLVMRTVSVMAAAGAVTTTLRVCVPVAPLLSVTVSVTEYVPAALYVLPGVAPVADVPSPKFQL